MTVADGSAPLSERAGLAGSLLVADDHALGRQTLSHLLSLLGHEVVTAENGRQALTLLRQRRFDLVLLDVIMPEMDGVETLKQIKADPLFESWDLVRNSRLSVMPVSEEIWEKIAEMAG